MAGGKETPRQKMIGMMYLVLTALLALQVSNAVLEKFIFIDRTLTTQTKEMDTKNNKTLTGISTEVEKKGKRAADVAALTKAQKVREMTNDVIKYMNQLKSDMAIWTGGGDEDGYDEEGNLIGAKNYDIVGNKMITQGKGAELKKKLNDYSSQLSTLAGEKFAPIARDAKDIPEVANDGNQNKKNFTEFYFGNTPTAAGMATVSQLMTEVLTYESKALEDIATQVGAKDVEFDKIVPLVRPASNTVAAGSDYEADLFITASSSGIDPKFMYNNKPAPTGVDPSGIKFGKIKFKATGGNYDSKTLTAEKQFEAEIELKDTTYKIKHKYYVVKPVIQVRSAALSALYLNCGNELDVQVPALGTSYSPSFSSSQAKVIKGSKTGKVTVIPTGRSKVKLSVSNGGSLLGSETFSVKKVPLPSYEFKAGGKAINFKNGAKATAFRSMTVKPKADENFAAEVPKDARYRIREMNVTLARGTRPVKQKKVTREKVSLSDFAAVARPGDRIVVEIRRVERRTYQGGTEKVPTRNEIYTIPLN